MLEYKTRLVQEHLSRFNLSHQIDWGAWEVYRILLLCICIWSSEWLQLLDGIWCVLILTALLNICRRWLLWCKIYRYNLSALCRPLSCEGLENAGPSPADCHSGPVCRLHASNICLAFLHLHCLPTLHCAVNPVKWATHLPCCHSVPRSPVSRQMSAP